MCGNFRAEGPRGRKWPLMCVFAGSETHIWQECLRGAAAEMLRIIAPASGAATRMRAFWRREPRFRGAAAETLRIIAPAPRAATRMRGIPAAEHQNGPLLCRRGTITGAFTATGPSADLAVIACYLSHRSFWTLQEGSLRAPLQRAMGFLLLLEVLYSLARAARARRPGALQ